jgi:hypothetical protein
MSIDISAIVTTVIPTVAGVGTGIFGIIWGVHTYKQGQIAKRQEVLFPLIQEFNNISNALTHAKKILDDIAIPPQSGWEKSNSNYGIIWEDIQDDYRPLKDFLKKELKLNWVEDRIFRRDGESVKIEDGTQYVSFKLIKEQGSQRTRVEVKVNNHETYNFIA